MSKTAVAADTPDPKDLRIAELERRVDALVDALVRARAPQPFVYQYPAPCLRPHADVYHGYWWVSPSCPYVFTTSGYANTSFTVTTTPDAD